MLVVGDNVDMGGWSLVIVVTVTVKLTMLIRFTSTGHMLLRAPCPKGQHGR